MSAFVELFGESLLSGEKNIQTAEALKGKRAVGVYFSAHWCPPCRGFTPKLAEWYSKSLQEKGLEVVFVSSDRDQAAFDSYYKEQPWLALDFSKRDIKDALSKKFKVRGIPSFVILDGETGAVITMDGRGSVTSDPTGESFPWKPRSLEEICKDEEFVVQLKSTDEKKTDVQFEKMLEMAENKNLEAIGFYFSAHWCPPCRSYTPQLAKAYTEVNKEKKRLEIVFVSCDRDEKSFNEYFGEQMPWCALKFDKKKVDSALSKYFDVNGIPHFVLVNPKTKEVIVDGVGGRISNTEAFPWLPEPVKEIDEDPSGIDEDLSLVLLQESDDISDEEKKTNKETLKTMAKEYKKLVGRDVAYFTASKSGRLAERVRSECGKEEKNDTKKVTAVMMDIGSEEYYDFEYNEVTADTLKKFFQAFSDKKIESKPMGA